MKNLSIRPYNFGGDDLNERSNFGLKIEFFHYFFLKFGLPCRKGEASQRFWYQEVGLIFCFEIDYGPICITIYVPVIAHFP